MMGSIAAISTAIVTTLVYLIHTTYHHRSKINALRRNGMPMPKGWNWFTGHLLTLQEYVDKLPPDANVNLAMNDLALEFADTEVFLMDFWPVYPALLMVYDPDTAVQISTKYNLPKTDMHLQFMKPITGGPNLVSMSGLEWKFWRTLFNPGFSSSAMMDNVPHIVNFVQVFCDKLKENAGRGMLLLDGLTTRLTMDVIIKLTLDADLDYQRSENALATSLGYITRWHSFWDPRILMHPLRPFIQKYHGRVMDNYIQNELDQRFSEIRARFNDPDAEQSNATKSVITLAIESYIQENKSNDLMQKPKLDSHFAKYATHQIRLFLFAGNDTTSSTIVYVYHLLSQHPEALKSLRKEHDDVFGTDIFGTDINQTAKLLREQPTLLNKCPFTLAVIKETLRLCPPAATMRAGQPGVKVTDRHGNCYPMDYVGATLLHPAIHRNPRVWPLPNDFLPERFLVDPGHELYPNPAAYRPFEQGPRNCIGQTLVYNEIRIVMIMTVRMFDVKPAYEEWDAMREREIGVLGRFKKSVFGEPVKTVRGDRAYQTEKAGTHPADGYPCRISLRGGGGGEME
ncbi:Cytochrome P450 [Glarea lozoyensis ATCC 20868]|uniref:Cytochrome P450 n=1 Tax=Glarea lozoyensis (strain ATCC 20868 / MF5171) TaxID=1116229 RepID=S3D4A1_GLAL2|nr:Cytochrome P450 [Glarea lozoyensis ATCC 20868]EPE32645.1 Cytochrome P450 [Glarea lozoyensis ATCC 20868]